MKKILTDNIFLILGILIFLVGCIQPYAYERAKESGYEVEATIVDVKVRDESDADGGFVSTSYTVYADYQVDGKEYKHVRIGKYYDTDEYYVGKTVKVVVDPDDPGDTMFEGGILCTVGFVITGVAIFFKIKNRKKNTA